jgi:hypothetical protein
MSSLGKVFCNNWSLAVNSLSIEVCFQDQTEDLVTDNSTLSSAVRFQFWYSIRLRVWCSGQKTLQEYVQTKLTHKEKTYSLTLNPPSNAYLFAIEELLAVMKNTPKKNTFRALYHRLKKNSVSTSTPTLLRNRSYYKQLLQRSACFRKTKITVSVDSVDSMNTNPSSTEHTLFCWTINQRRVQHFRQARNRTQVFILCPDEHKDTFSIVYKE